MLGSIVAAVNGFTDAATQIRPVARLLLGAGFVLLLIVRARLEEQKLASADEAYRQYAARTGFLFPRLKK